MNFVPLVLGLVGVSGCFVEPLPDGEEVYVTFPGGAPDVEDPTSFDEPLAFQAVPGDADGDGYDASVDCNDRELRVHPGATETCDGFDNDCDPSTSEDGTAWHRSSGGRWTDLTSVLAAGSSLSAANVNVGGGTLYICAGTWYLGLNVVRDANVVGPAGASRTRIYNDDWTGGLRVLGSANTVAVSGLTIEGLPRGTTFDPYVEYVGGVVGCVPTAGLVNLTIRDSILENGGGELWEGGGIFAQGLCDVRLVNSVVRGNTANFGGGLWGWGGANFTLIHSVVQGNYAGLGGGGIGVDDIYGPSSLTLTNSVVADNTAGYVGGGVAAYDGTRVTCTGSPTSAAGIVRNTLVSSSYGGGGLYVNDYGAGTTEVVGVDCDMGEGATDNALGDVFLGDALLSYAFGADADFVCDETGCS